MAHTAMKKLVPKTQGAGLELRTFQGPKGTYLVIRVGNAYHTFCETEAKQAAIECGSTLPRSANTREHWKKLWARP